MKRTRFCGGEFHKPEVFDKNSQIYILKGKKSFKMSDVIYFGVLFNISVFAFYLFYVMTAD
jgi:hypothetical protein